MSAFRDVELTAAGRAGELFVRREGETPMNGHAKGSPNSCRLCDAILAKMVALHPGIARTEVGHPCALHQISVKVTRFVKTLD
jgi:hypothetical protein